MLVLCCGMPRSGSTLQFNVAWKAVTLAGVGHRVEWMPGSEIERQSQRLSDFVADDAVWVMKTHRPPESVRELIEQRDEVRVLYVHRDIRDVVYSMKVKFKFTSARAVSRVRESLEVEEWLRTLPSEKVLVQRYEDLVSQLDREIASVAQFLGAQLADEMVVDLSRELGIDEAYRRGRARRVRFEHLRRWAARLRRGRAVFADDELMLHPNHVSEHMGRPGVGKECLSPAELAEVEHHFHERIERGFDVA